MLRPVLQVTGFAVSRDLEARADVPTNSRQLELRVPIFSFGQQ